MIVVQITEQRATSMWLEKRGSLKLASFKVSFGLHRHSPSHAIRIQHQPDSHLEAFKYLDLASLELELEHIGPLLDP